MKCFENVGFLKDMIDLFGGIRFRYMDLFLVIEMQLLLNAGAKTLEVLRLYPTEFREEASLDDTRVPADDLSASFSLGDIDLSQNKSFRVLEVAASSVLGGKFFLMHALSTIISPAFSEVVIFYRDYNFRGVGSMWFQFPCTFRQMSEDDVEKEALQHHMQFELFREMHKVRGFRLVLCVDVWDRVVKYT